jgi:protein-disulfide isomerase
MPKTPVRKKSKFDIASIAVLFLPVAFLLGIGAGYLLWGSSSGSAGNAAGAAFNPVGDDPAFGPEDAPITIVEFSDYQCPYCIMWHEQVYHQLLSEYGDKIRFVYRDFPLTQIHPGAQPAAEAADCALEQDKYWEYHDAIFSSNYELTRDGFLQIASDLGMDTTAFATCIDSGKYAEEVLTDLQEGSGIGVESTPTFYINGFQVVGAQPYSAFKNVIDQILAGSK